MPLHIARGLDLPNDLITQAIAILARRGAGKTYTASVIVEEVIGAGLPVCVIDPTGAWWGLRSSADGKRAGLPVIILGGSHGDVPLESTAGKVIADLVVDHPGAYVLDLSAFESNAAQDRFATDFMERLYRAKNVHPDALLLVVDEADSFAPQRPQANQMRMLGALGALEAIVRRGRIRGLGCLLITQRAAVLNKNVLTQIEVLIAMQTTSPQDRDAIGSWVEANATKAELAEVGATLAGLKPGEAWFWSPSWQRMLKRIVVRKRHTFDSSKTPEAGAVAIVPKARAAVDLAALGAQIAATVEQAKANDPALLRAEIADLRRQLANVKPEKVIERIEVPAPERVPSYEHISALVEHQRRALEKVAEAAGSVAAMQNVIRAEARAGEVAETGRQFEAMGRVRVYPPAEGPRPVSPKPVVDPKPQLDGIRLLEAERKQRISADQPLSKAERAILAALAPYHPRPRTKRQVALLAGYAGGGGAFNNALSKLRTGGLIEGFGEMGLTEAGVAATAGIEPLPTGQALIDYWMAQLGKAERAALEVAIRHYPNAIAKAELGEQAGYAHNGGGFNNALSRLRTLQLIVGMGSIKASEELFG